MLQRKAYRKLLDWKKDRNHKALCVFGARQIGKTTLIRKFGTENYKYFVELNFVSDTNASEIFAGSLDANTIITNLTAYTRKPMEPGETLIFFDEVQECPNVRTAIKFLVEDGRFDYVESGSLLGTRDKQIKSCLHFLYAFLFLNHLLLSISSHEFNCTTKTEENSSIS